MSIFQQHNDEIASLVPRQFSKGTLERYKTSMSQTVEFIKFKYQVSDMDVRNINHEFITGYDLFLRSVRSFPNNSTVKYLKNLKKIIRICIANGWIDRHPFANYKGKLKEVATVYLSDEELQTVLKREFTIDRLIQVKDIFIFCCLTGLTYADVKKMNADNIVHGCDGKKWLFLKRTTTGTLTTIPLLPSALELLDKYEKHSLIAIVANDN